ncbi:MAG: hypothetical protein ACRETD_06980 [Steroidobacteraceae bacterium]
MAFRGAVSCRRDFTGPLGLTLSGLTADHPDENASLAFSGRAPDTLPEALENPTVDRIDDGRYRIASARREWVVEATAVHLHREIATSFYDAIPPRTAPWSKRLFWRVVLGMATSSWGKRALRALRRR